MQLRSPSRARALRAAAVLPIAMLAVGGHAAPAAAAPVALDLNYTCTFPLLKPQPLKLHITSDIPSEVQIGKPTGAFAITATAAVNAGANFGLRSVDATTVEGSAIAVTDVVQPAGTTLVAKVPTTIPKVTLPDSGGFDTQATGATPSLTFNKAGDVKLNVRDLILTLTPRLADGTLTGLDTFETECTQDAGQANTLATIKVVDPAATGTTSYALAGQAYIKTIAQGTVPVTGSASLTRDASTGAVDGTLALDPARGSLKALKLFPVNASFVFTPVDRATGTLTGNTLALTTKQNIRLTNVTVLGINLVTGTCQTGSPATIALKSNAGAFVPETGGSALAAAFTIPPLTNCGALGAIVSGLTAGAGNALSLKFTPKTAA